MNGVGNTCPPSPGSSNSLRRFRIQKKTLGGDFDTSQSIEMVNSPDIVIPMRRNNVILDSSEDDRSPMKNPPLVGLHGLVSIFRHVNPQVIEKYLIESQGDFAKAKQAIQQAYPRQDLSVPSHTPLNSHGNTTGKRKFSPEQLSHANGSKPKAKKFKKIKRARDDSEDESSGEDGDGYNEEKRVFDSDEDSDAEVSNDTTKDQNKVFEFMSEATLSELLCMPSISGKKADAIMELRPFESWRDLVEKLQNNKGLSSDILNHAAEFLYTRQVVEQLMKKCSKLSADIERLQAGGISLVRSQPTLLSPELTLASYQMIGLNWLVMLNKKGLNGILADEMGLGKTVQVIAFLAWLKQTAEQTNPYLIVVPASTLDNWGNELKRWCPALKVLTYYGEKEERRLMRIRTMHSGKVKDYDVVLTTYNLLTSSPEEKKMFKTIRFEYVVFDEAHMLKNMNTARYEQLSNVNAHRRILLTGTPLQNNLLELMSLLTFVMPDMFKNKKQYLKCLFARNSVKDKNEETKPADTLPRFEQEQVAQAKKIMKPFVLRRLKVDVLKDLPTKTDVIKHCDMTPRQRNMYDTLVHTYAEERKLEDESEKTNHMGMMMQLRKVSNHPLLVRELYRNDQIATLARILAKEPNYKETNEQYVQEDLSILSDFELHRLCQAYPGIYKYALKEEDILDSGKFRLLDEMLPVLQQEQHRLLIFSQFVIMLNVLEQYMHIRGYKFLRLDGSTAVPDRQEMIDQFNRDPSISVFLLSTRAGGLGINLTAADTVIIHDLDFNPYNDKQAEDRCHRVGQTRPVSVYRFISNSSIDEDIFQIASEKLHLEKEISSQEKDEAEVTVDTKQLLRKALGRESAGKGSS